MMKEILKYLQKNKNMKQEKVAFDFLAELENLGFKKDDMEEVFIRPRDGFSFKMIKANNGKDTFSLINMKKQFNRHVATCEWPYNEEEFFILMKKLSVI